MVANITSFSPDRPQPPKERKQSPLRMMSELQHLLMQDARREDTKPVARSMVARAIKELEALKREIRMKPKPRPVDVSPTGKKPKSVPFHEPAEAPPKTSPLARSPQADREAAKTTPPTPAEAPAETPPDAGG